MLDRVNVRLAGLIGLLTATFGIPSARQPGCTTIDPAAAIAKAGAFSNVRYTEEHAYGYSIMLWRAGGCVFGVFESAQGLAEDTPVGALEDVAYDGTSGRLTFTAKLTTGLTTVPGSRDLVPAHDLFSFAGTWKGDPVRGELAHTLANIPGAAPAREAIVLVPSPDAADLMLDAAPYADWRKAWDPILRRRGPKW